jgi:integrase
VDPDDEPLEGEIQLDGSEPWLDGYEAWDRQGDDESRDADEGPAVVAPTALVAPPEPQAVVLRQPTRELRERDAQLKQQPLSAASRRAYRHDWQRWSAWADVYGYPSMPAQEEHVRLFLLELEKEGLAIGTLKRMFASLRSLHMQKGQTLPTMPTVRNVLRNLARERDEKPLAKAPLMAGAMQRAKELLPRDATGVRDLALLLLGWTGAFRRSELANLEVRDLRFTPEGVVVLLRKSKTDQEGEGRPVGVHYAEDESVCAVRALRSWLEGAGIDRGPVFRRLKSLGGGRFMVLEGRINPSLVAVVVKNFARLAGLNADRYAGHSLRAGFVTSAAEQKVPLERIMQTTGHTSEAMVRRYIRHASPFDGSGGKGLLDHKPARSRHSG